MDAGIRERIRARAERLAFHVGHRLMRRWLTHEVGHFYSPLCHPGELAERRATLWPGAGDMPGVDLDIEGQRRLLRDVFPPLLIEFAYPTASADPHAYTVDNPQFQGADARSLFALLRHWRPRRVIEVGSGYSTLLMADVNRRLLGGAMEITAIEPYPRDFLHDLPGLAALRIERVQDTPDAVFDTLADGDVLFIDSSHVLKTGSDLTHLLTRVLPRLSSGVRVHLHDVFLPDEYPPHWVLDLNRSWNEQYALHAVLANGSRYRVLYGTQFALTRLATDAAAAFGSLAGQPYAGGSFWIQVQ
jgi:hypothetical protein